MYLSQTQPAEIYLLSTPEPVLITIRWTLLSIHKLQKPDECIASGAHNARDGWTVSVYYEQSG